MPLLPWARGGGTPRQLQLDSNANERLEKTALGCGHHFGRGRHRGFGFVPWRTNQRSLDNRGRSLRLIGQLSFLQQMVGDEGPGPE